MKSHHSTCHQVGWRGLLAVAHRLPKNTTEVLSMGTEQGQGQDDFAVAQICIENKSDNRQSRHPSKMFRPLGVLYEHTILSKHQQDLTCSRCNGRDSECIPI